jgi:hypothetical protein
MEKTTKGRTIKIFRQSFILSAKIMCGFFGDGQRWV